MAQAPTPYNPLGFESIARPAPRQPLSPRAVLAWAVIIASSATIVATTAYRYRHLAKPSAAEPSEGRIAQLILVAKYSIGARDILRAASAGPAQQLQQMTGEMDGVAVAPTERLRVAITAGEMADGKAALTRIHALEPAVTSAAAKQDVTDLTQIYTFGPDSLDAAHRDRLVQRYGWFGHLALGFKADEKTPDNADRQIALAAAHRVAIGLIVALVAGLALLALGLVLLILLVVFSLEGKVPRRFMPAPGATVPFLEAFAIYLGSFLLIPLIARYVAPRLSEHLGVYESVLLLPPALAIVWPRVCGVPTPRWRQALGWHTGRGIFREIGLGITGYIAGLPLLALMFGISMVLIKLAGAQPDHPVMHQLTGSRGLLLEVFLLACAYAPLVEETMFRGAFFNYLRSSHGWLISALCTSLIFAAIHPQGWTLIPVLGGIAMILAAIREWRGTILASATAHALNNGMVLLLAVTVLR